ncbi:MAG: phosphodiester glycosidase family protein [Ruminococcaceae bacterium]|nr:phosphodiester glycosidase family protein [Oscillospiraceae bacterium]
MEVKDYVKKEENKKRTVGFSQSDYLDYAGFKRRRPKSEGLTAKRIIGRCAIALSSLLLFAIIAVYGLCFTIAKGPSETVRNLLVLSAKQASATKWVPALFLSSDTIDEIMAQSEEVRTDIISVEDYYASSKDGESGEVDEWANAKDGMIFKTLKGSTYTAYMLIVKDPSRVFVGTSSANYESSQRGKRIFEAAEDLNAVAAINGGEFPDSGGIGTGAHPIGLTYSGGKCVWNDGTKRTFIGFDKDNKLVVAEPMTKAGADALGIRDAVSFQTGNVLISSDGENVTFYYAEGNNGTAQRTAIGQRADGAVIMLVTDGRTASSLGATHNDVIDIMVEHGAINAAMLDGGSSAMMYYENYYEKYDYDYESLDQYQKKGLVNKYKAFTTPRYMPTFFMVASIDEGGAENAD